MAKPKKNEALEPVDQADDQAQAPETAPETAPEAAPTIEPEVLAQLVPVKKFGEPNLHIHPDHLDEYRKLGWEVIN